MERIIMIIMAAGALLGGLDRMLGNRLGLGEKFEEGFRLLGPVALALSLSFAATMLTALAATRRVSFFAAARGWARPFFPPA